MSQLNEYEEAVLQWEDFVTTPEGEFELGEQTVIQYISTITSFGREFDNKNPELFTPEDIKKYLAGLRKQKLKGNTIHNKLSAIKSFFYVLRGIGLITSDPSLEVKTSTRRGKRSRGKKKKKQLTIPEIKTLFETLETFRYKNKKKDPNAERDRLIIEVLYSTGMRRGELANKREKWGVMVSALNLDEMVIKEVRRKGGFNQDIIITNILTFLFPPEEGEEINPNADIKAKLREWIKKKDLKGNDKLFSISARWVNDITKKWGRRAGFPFTLTSHWIRHTFGSHLGDIGVPAQFIQDLMDHESIVTTDQYVTTTKEGAKKSLFVYGLYKPMNFDKEGVDYPVGIKEDE